MEMSYRTYLVFRRLLYRFHSISDNDSKYYAYRKYFDSFYALYGWSYCQRMFRIHEKEYMRRYNIKRRWKEYLSGMIRPYENLYLLSLTFTDDILSSTSSETRKKYILKFLNDNTVDYFACIDFGEKNGREHYHAICRISFHKQFIPYLRGKTIFYEVYPFDYPYGFMSIREISLNTRDVEKSMFYAFKSSLYAFKSSNDNIKPFHKRGSFHFCKLSDSACLLL